jgi:hypothetical protein
MTFIEGRWEIYTKFWLKNIQMRGAFGRYRHRYDDSVK